ncbi:unnamed protein product, partial [Mesorhabditis spiculigera]
MTRNYVVLTGSTYDLGSAISTCALKGASLASIHSHADNEFVWRLTYGPKGKALYNGWNYPTIMLGGVQYAGAKGLTYGLMGELNAYNWYRPSVLLGGIQDNLTRVSAIRFHSFQLLAFTGSMAAPSTIPRHA